MNLAPDVSPAPQPRAGLHAPAAVAGRGFWVPQPLSTAISALVAGLVAAAAGLLAPGHVAFVPVHTMHLLTGEGSPAILDAGVTIGTVSGPPLFFVIAAGVASLLAPRRLDGARALLAYGLLAGSCAAGFVALAHAYLSLAGSYEHLAYTVCGLAGGAAGGSWIHRRGRRLSYVNEARRALHQASSYGEVAEILGRYLDARRVRAASVWRTHAGHARLQATFPPEFGERLQDHVIDARGSVEGAVDDARIAVTLTSPGDADPIGLVLVHLHGAPPGRAAFLRRVWHAPWDLALSAAGAVDRLQAREHGRLLGAYRERERHARDVHDGIVQDILGVLTHVQALARLHPHALSETAQPLVDQLRQTLSKARGMIDASGGPAAGAAGAAGEKLSSLLLKQVERWSRLTGIPADPDIREVPADPGPRAAAELQLVLGEALSNVLKHAGATAVSVGLRHSGELLELTVWDNGVGLRAADNFAGSGRGLRNMRHRVRGLGGSFAAGRAPGGGTLVRVTLPVGPDGTPEPPSREAG